MVTARVTATAPQSVPVICLATMVTPGDPVATRLTSRWRLTTTTATRRTDMAIMGTGMTTMRGSTLAPMACA